MASRRDREAKDILSGKIPEGGSRSGSNYYGATGNAYDKSGKDVYSGQDIYTRVGNSIYKNGSYKGEI